MNKTQKELREQAFSWHLNSMETMRSVGHKTAEQIEGIIARDYGYLMAAYTVHAITENEIDTMMESIKNLGNTRRGSGSTEAIICTNSEVTLHGGTYLIDVYYVQSESGARFFAEHRGLGDIIRTNEHSTAMAAYCDMLLILLDRIKEGAI